jgi:hypothetical protein
MDSVLAAPEEVQARATAARAAVGARLAQLADGDLRANWQAIAQAADETTRSSPTGGGSRRAEAAETRTLRPDTCRIAADAPE